MVHQRAGIKRLLILFLFSDAMRDSTAENDEWVDHGSVGWCFGGAKLRIEDSAGAAVEVPNAADCWDLCGELIGDENLVSVDYWNSDGHCYCQDACTCLIPTSSSDGQLLTLASLAGTVEDLPSLCHSGKSHDFGADQDMGWCYGGMDLFIGDDFDTAGECWTACFIVLEAYGKELIAVDFWSEENACYCQVRIHVSFKY